MRITRIRIACLEHPPDPPLHAAWDRIARHVLVPRAPGLGIELSRDAVRALDAAP
jgi:L-alanine-DL-glutamate epimerase-like enolase superfamily enzyme